jgi:beta-lactamase class D
LGLLILGFSISAAQAGTVCTIVANAKSGDVLQQEGDCYSRVTPASTFKIAISMMGFDAAFLQDEHFPTLPYHPGDPDWGGAAWLEPTDAVRWFQYSVVWFSQRVTHALGEATSSDKAHGYGWFVGWATKDEHSLVFARLVQDDRAQPVPAGLRVRDALMEQWPQLANSLVK